MLSLHDITKLYKWEYQIVIFRLCFSIYRFLALAINCSFLSWNDLLLSEADLGKDAAAVFNRDELDESDADVEEPDDVEGWLVLLFEADGISGTKCKRPSKIFVIVLSTLLVIAEKLNYVLLNENNKQFHSQLEN